MSFMKRKIAGDLEGSLLKMAKKEAPPVRKCLLKISTIMKPLSSINSVIIPVSGLISVPIHIAKTIAIDPVLKS